MTEFLAAIAGAIVGGVITILMQKHALKAAKDERLEDHVNRRKAQAYSLLIKMIKIHSAFTHFHRHIEECLKRPIDEGRKIPPSQAVVPLANLPDKITFSADEMTMLLSLKNNELFNEMMDIDQIYNAALDGFAVYKVRRQLLTDNIHISEFTAPQATTVLSPQEEATNRARMFELDDLIISLGEMCSVRAPQSKEVLDKLTKTFNESLGMNHRIVPV